MKKTRLVTVVGTRPELIRLSRVICELDVFFDHILVHTGQNYDYELKNQVFYLLGMQESLHQIKKIMKNF